MASSLEAGSGTIDPEAERRRIEAMQRALASAQPVGPTGPQGPAAGDSYRAVTAPPTSVSGDNSLSQGESYDTRTDSVKNAVGPTGPVGPATTAQGPDAMERALSTTGLYTPPDPNKVATGGSIAAALVPPTTTTTTSTTGGGKLPPPPPPITPVQSVQTGTGGGTGGTDTLARWKDLSGNTGATGGTDTTADLGGIDNQNTTGDTSGNTGEGSLGAITNQLMSQIANIGSTLANPGTPSDVTGVFLTQAKSILSLLDQQDAELRADAEKNGTQIDPSTQFTIDKLRETLQENLKGVREDLNRRGLYESGIELDLENKLQKGSASDQARILADRLSTIQQQLQSGLQANRKARVDTLGQFGLSAANAQTTHDENQYRSADEREQAALAAMLGLRGQANSADIASQDRAASNANSAASRALQAAQLKENGRQYDETYAMDKAKYNQNFEYNAQQDAMTRALAAAKGTTAATTPPQINNPYGGTTKTPGVNTEATNAAISAIGKATSRTQATQDLSNAAANLIAQGVDVQQVIDAINSRFPESADSVRGNRTVGGPI